jgi:hypothetical protein
MIVADEAGTVLMMVFGAGSASSMISVRKPSSFSSVAVACAAALFSLPT